MLHTLLIALGLTDASGPEYLFWSGFFGDIPIILGVAIWYWHNQCHQPGCFYIARHKYDNGTFQYCKKHHPLVGKE